MRKEESIFRAKVGSELRRYGYIAQPIESPLTGDGIPDMYIAVNEAIGWIEFKVMRGIDIYRNKIPFRPGQYYWLRRNAKANAFSGVGIDCDLGYVFARISAIDEDYHLQESDSNLIIPSIHNNMDDLIDWLG